MNYVIGYLGPLLVILSYLASLFWFSRKYNFRTSVLISCFVASCVDLICNFCGLSTVFVYMIIGKKVAGGGYTILRKIPIPVSILLYVKAGCVFAMSYVYEELRKAGFVPHWLGKMLVVEGERE